MTSSNGYSASRYMYCTPDTTSVVYFSCQDTFEMDANMLETNVRQYRTPGDDTGITNSNYTQCGKQHVLPSKQGIISRRRKQGRITGRWRRESPRSQSNAMPCVDESAIVNRLAGLGLAGSRADERNVRVPAVNEGSRVGQIVRGIARRQWIDRERSRDDRLALRRYGGGEVMLDNVACSPLDEEMATIVKKLESFHIQDEIAIGEIPQAGHLVETNNSLPNARQDENSETACCSDYDVMGEVVEMLANFHVGGRRKPNTSIESCW